MIQDKVPTIQETGLQTLRPNYGEWPGKILMALRRSPRGMGFQEIMDSLGSRAWDAPAVEESLGDLVDLGIVEHANGNWRIAR